MKVFPKKPHFFKPIQPGFKHGVKIPIGFLKYLKGQEKEHAVLRRAGKMWKVKVNGRNLEEGWEKFADDHDLQLGNILVFRHEGNMEFEVVILDSSHYDTRYAEPLQEAKEEEKTHVIEETSKKFEFKDDPNPRIVPSGKGFHHAEDSTHSPIGRSHFESTIRSYYLRLPRRFVKENGLTNKKCGLIIRGEGRKSWNLRLYTSGPQVFVGGKWRKFCVENDLKVGDHVRFEVVTNGENPIWKFMATSKKFEFKDDPNPRIVPSGKGFHHAEDSAHSPIGRSRSHFESTIRSYYLRLPRRFVKENGLTNKKCGLIIRGEGRKSWNLRLYTAGPQVFVGGKWRKFCAENDLKVGDHVRFEVVTNGENPIWKFMSDLEPASTSADDDINPHFISTIKPYTSSQPVLLLPKAFVKANGLMNKEEMTLVDGKQRPWPVQLTPMGCSFGIKRKGWTRFMKANGVQVGDTYKFELINNGTVPTVYFRCKYSGKEAQLNIKDDQESTDKKMKQLVTATA